MPPKSTRDPHPGQASLFEVTPFGNTLLSIDVMAEPAQQGTLNVPAVDLLERIGSLKNTLDALGKVSMLGGLEQAATSQEFPHLRRPLERRYDDVDAVVGKSQDARAKNELKAKQAFAKAQGLKEMIDAEPSRKEELKEQVRADYADFLALYGDAKGSKNREELRKKLKKQERLIVKQRKAA